MLAFGAKQDDAGLLIFSRDFQRLDQLLDDHIVEGVALVWPVQHDFGNTTFQVVKQNGRGLFGHGVLSGYMRNTPKRVGLAGRFRVADRLRATTSRVWAGSITPSSHRRALA